MTEHVDNLNTIEKLEYEGFEGPDACLMISLFEYGLAWKKEGDEVLFIYGIKVGNNGDYVRFDRCTLSADTDPTKEWDWADFPNVVDCMGCTLEEWLECPLTCQVNDLLSYYGFENVFRSSYWEGFAIEGDDQHDTAEENE